MTIGICSTKVKLGIVGGQRTIPDKMMLVLVIIILSGGCFDSDGDHRGVRIPWSTVSCHHQPSSPSNPSIYHSTFFPAFFYFLFLPALVLRHSSTRQRLLKSSRECKMWDRILGIPLDTSGYPQLCNGWKVAQQSSLGYPQRCRAHIGGDLFTDQGGCMLWIPWR